MKFQTINCKFHHQGLLLNCTQLVHSQDRMKPVIHRDIPQAESKELAESISPLTSTKAAGTLGNSVSRRTEAGPLNVWNSSNLTYAEVVAGLRRQRQMAFKSNDQEKKSIASSNHPPSSQLKGQKVDKSVEETKLDKIVLKTDDKALKNKMTEGVGRKGNPKKNVQQNQLGKSESVVHTTIVENKFSSEIPAAIPDEYVNQSYADVLKALKSGQKNRITITSHTASNNREGSNYVVEKTMKITCEPIVQPSQLLEQCVQNDHLALTEIPLAKKQIITKQGNVSKKNKQKNKASIKNQADFLIKPTQLIGSTEKSMIKIIPHQVTSEAADNSKPSKNCSNNRVENSTNDEIQKTRKDLNVEIISGTSETNTLSDHTNEINIVGNNLKSDSTPQVQEDHVYIDKNRIVKKYEKIRKSNSSKMAAMLNKEKMQFEKEFNNGHSYIVTSLHENPNENLIVDTSQPCIKQQDEVTKICESPVNTFKTNLIFDDYDFMNTTCDKSKGAFKTDTVKTMPLGVVNNGKGTKSSEQIDTVSVKQDYTQQSSASSALDNQGVISSRMTDNDATKSDKPRIENIRWCDNRQKISMITHEEHMLKPVSFIKLELPNITADKFIYSYHKETPEDKHVYQDESNVPVEETSILDPSYRNECVVATEISMANSSSDDTCDQNSFSYAKQILTKEKSFENEEILLNYSKSSDDKVKREDEVFNKPLQTQFTTTTSSVSYKTCTILSEESGARHVIEEYYTIPDKTNQTLNQFGISTESVTISKDFSLEEHLLTATTEGSTMGLMEEYSADIKQLDQTSNVMQNNSAIHTVQDQVELQRKISAEEKTPIEMSEQSITRDAQIETPRLRMESSQQDVEHLMTPTKGESAAEMEEESSTDAKQIDQISDLVQAIASISTKQVGIEEDISTEEKLLIAMREQSLTRDEEIDEASLKMDSSQKENEKIERDTSLMKHLMTPTKEGSSEKMIGESSTDLKVLDQTSDPLHAASSILAENIQVESEAEINAEGKLLIAMRKQSLPTDEPVNEATVIKQIDETTDLVQAISSISAENIQVNKEEEMSVEEKHLIEIREQSLSIYEQIDKASLKPDSPRQEIATINLDTTSEECLMTTMREGTTTVFMEVSSTDIKQLDQISDPLHEIKSISAENIREKISTEDKIMEQSLSSYELSDEPSLNTKSSQQEDAKIENGSTSDEHLVSSMREGTTPVVMDVSSTDFKEIDQKTDSTQVISLISTDQEQVEFEEEISAEEKLLVEMREQSMTRDNQIDEPNLKMDSSQHEAVKKDQVCTPEEPSMTPVKEDNTMEMLAESSTDIKEIDQTSDSTQVISSICTKQEQAKLEEEISAEEKLLIEMREQSLPSDEQIDEPSLKTKSEENLTTSMREGTTTVVMDVSSKDFKEIDQIVSAQIISSICTKQEQVELEEEISAEEKLLIEMREQSLPSDEQIDEPSLKTKSEEHLTTSMREGTTPVVMDVSSTDFKEIDQISDSTQIISSICTKQEQVELDEDISAEEKLLIEKREQSLPSDEQIDEPSLKTKSEEHLTTSMREGTTPVVMDVSSTDFKEIDQISDSTQIISSICTKQEQVELDEEISAEEKLLIEKREQSLPSDEQIDEPSLKTKSEEHLTTPMREGTTTVVMDVSSTDFKEIDQISDSTKVISSISTDQEQVEFEEDISAEEKLLIEMREPSLSSDEQIDEPSLKTKSEEHLTTSMREGTTTVVMDVSSTDFKEIDQISDSTQTISSICTKQEQAKLEEEISAEEKLLIEKREQSLPSDEQIDEPSLKTKSEEHLTTREGTTTMVMDASSTDFKEIDQISDSTQIISSICTKQEQVELKEDISAEEKLLIEKREQSLPSDEQIDEPSLKTKSEEHLTTSMREGTTTVVMDASSTDFKEIDQISDSTQIISSICTKQEQAKLEEEISAEEKLLIEMREQSLPSDEQIDEPSLKTKSEEHLTTSMREGTTPVVMDVSSTDFKEMDQISDSTKVISSISTDQEQVELKEDISAEEKLLIEMREPSLSSDEQIDEPSLKTKSEEHLTTPMREGTTTMVMDASSTDFKEIDQISGSTQIISSICTKQEQVELKEDISAEEKLLIEKREQSLPSDEQIDEPSLKTKSEEHLSTSMREGTSTDFKEMDQISDSTKVISSISTDQEQVKFEEDISAEKKLLIEKWEQSLPSDEQIDEPSLKTKSEEHLTTSMREGTTTVVMDASSTDFKEIDQISDSTQIISSICTKQEQAKLEEEISAEEKLLIEMREQSLPSDEQIDEPSLKTKSEEHLTTSMREGTTPVVMDVSSTDFKEMDQISDSTKVISSISTDQEQVELKEDISAEEKLLIEMREPSLSSDEQIDEPSLKTKSEEHLTTSMREGTTTMVMDASSTDFKEIDQISDSTQIISSICTKQEQAKLEEEISAEEKLLIKKREQSLPSDEQIDEPSLKTKSEEHLTTSMREGTTPVVMDVSSTDFKEMDQIPDSTKVISSISTDQEQVEFEEEISAEEKLLVEMREQSMTGDDQIDEPNLNMDSSQHEAFKKDQVFTPEEPSMTPVKEDNTMEMLAESSTDIDQIDRTSESMQAVSSISTKNIQAELEEGISTEEKLLIAMREQSLLRDEQIDEPSLKTKSEEHLTTSMREGTTTVVMDVSSTDFKEIDQTSDSTQVISSICSEQEQVELEEEISAEEKLLNEIREQSLARYEQIDEPSLKKYSSQKEEKPLISPTMEETATEVIKDASMDIKLRDQTSDPPSILSISAENFQVDIEEEISANKKLLIEIREQSLSIYEQIDEASLKLESPSQEVAKINHDTISEEHLMTTMRDGTATVVMEVSSKDIKLSDETSETMQAIYSISTENIQVELAEEASAEEKHLIEIRKKINVPGELLMTSTKEESSTEFKWASNSMQIDRTLDFAAEQEHIEEEEISDQFYEPNEKMNFSQHEDVRIEKDSSPVEPLMTPTMMTENSSMDIKQLEQTSDLIKGISSIPELKIDEDISAEERVLIQSKEQSFMSSDQIDEPSLKTDLSLQEDVTEDKDTSSEEHQMISTKEGSTTYVMKETTTDLTQPDKSSISTMGFSSFLTEQKNEPYALIRTESLCYENPANIQCYNALKDAEVKYRKLSEHKEKTHEMNYIASLSSSSVFTIEQLATQRSLIDTNVLNTKSDNQNNTSIPTNDFHENRYETNDKNFDCSNMGGVYLLKTLADENTSELLKLQHAERQYFEHIDNEQKNTVDKMVDESNDYIEKPKESEVQVESSLAVELSLLNSFAISTYLSELQRVEKKYYEIKCSENPLPQELLTESCELNTNGELKSLVERENTLDVNVIPVMTETKEEQHDFLGEVEFPHKKAYLEELYSQNRDKNNKKHVSFSEPVYVESTKLTSPDGLSIDNSTTGSDNIWNKGLLYSEVVAQNLAKDPETLNFSTITVLKLNEQPVQSSFDGDIKETVELFHQKSSIIFNVDENKLSTIKSTAVMQEKKQDKYHASPSKDNVDDIILDSPVIESSPIVIKDLISGSNQYDSSKNDSLSNLLDTTSNNKKIGSEIEHTDNFDLTSLFPFNQNESWLNKSVYDKAECLYYTIKSREDANTIDVIQPAVKDVDELNGQPKCAAKQLTIASSVLNVPMTHGITNSDDPETPIQPTEHHSIGSTNNVALNCSEQYDPESTISKQILPHGVENILESLLSAELKMNNLPYDNVNDLIKGLQVLIEKLADYKQQNYAISMSLPPNADFKIHESVRQIDDRIDFLRQRAHDGLEKVQQTLKIREQRKKEVQSYLLLLEEIESWLSTSSIQLDDVDDSTSEDDLKQMFHRNENLLCDLTGKETKARTIYAKMDEFLKYSDVCDRTMLLKENLGVIIRTMREKTLILENNIERLKQKQQPMASTMVNTEMQTSPPISLEVISRVPVEQQDTSSQTHKIGSTDNILIIQSVSNGQETVQISNVRNTPFMGTSDDIIVEAKYTHPLEGESKKSSELLLQNIPSQFESTFVEPDDSTTEIVVDKDGSKTITLRKTIQPTESIGPCEISSTSTLDAKILPPIIEGTVLEVKTPKPGSEEIDVACNIVGEILDHIQENVVFSVDKTESELVDIKMQDSQVFESDAHKVDLIASVVDSPSTSTVFSQQSTSEPYSNLTEKIDSKHNASVIEPVGEIWPPSESITTGEFGRSLKIDDPSTLRTIQSNMFQPDIISDEIWPQSLATGSNYIDVAPQFPTLIPAENESSIKQDQISQDAMPGTEADSHAISVTCKEYPIDENKQQVPAAPDVKEKLEEESLVNEFKEPSSEKTSVKETSINQLKPIEEDIESTLDHIISEVRRDSLSNVKPQETKCKDEAVITDIIASPPNHIILEENRDSDPVFVSYETESKDEVLTAAVVESPPGQDERIDSIPIVEFYESKTQNEDIMEKYCDDNIKQQTNVLQTECGSDGKLEVKVASTKEEQSSLKLTMNIVPLDAKKISVSLIEVGHADSKTAPIDDPSQIEESKISKDLLSSEKIPGLSDIDYDKGYEADKTAVEGESGTDDSQKKKKRKKKKQRNETDKAINTELLEPPVVPSGSLEIGSASEGHEIKVTQEGIVNVPTETSSLIQERVIVTTEVIEAVYVEDVQQQTTPVEFGHPDFGFDQEVSKITSEKLIVPIDLEQKSMQTSPEPEVLKMSHQTSPIQTSALESDAKEIQTAIQVYEIETQTLNTSPKHQTEQESQTEVDNSEYVDKSAATPVIDVVDMANQTTITNTAEMEIQTMENVSEIVEPLVTNIINMAVNDETIYRHHSIQTSPISFETSKEEDVPVFHESIQTIEPEILDAHVGTEQILREKASSPISQETKSDVQMQTSPIHETAIVLGKRDSPNESFVENINQDTQTMIIPVVDNQAQTNPEPTTSVSKVTIPCTDISTEDKTSSKNRKKKTKKTKSDGKIPLHVEVSAQFEVPDSCTEIDTFTISETIISEANVDPKSDLDIHVHLDIDSPSQRSESFRINELISDEKILSLGLHNYLSILKSQQNYAEHKKVPWNQMASVLENMYKTGNSLQTQYYNSPRTTSADGEDQENDYLGLERALHSLQENSNDATIQNQICFELLESISIPAEEVIADLNKLHNLNHSDCLRICQMHRQRLIYMLKIMQRIIIFIKNNRTQLNPDVVKCFELTANELSQLDNQVSSLETECQQKQAHTDRLVGALHDVNAQIELIDEKLSNMAYDETVSINKKLLQLDELEQQYLECANRLRSVSKELQTFKKKTFDGDLEALLEATEKKSRKLSHSVILERNKLNQLNSLAEEYEQTLLEFQDITEAAESFIKNNIVTNSLEELQEEMQRYRKFFVNLNHCKMILLSLESNLDPITRLKHANLHSSLYHKTASILENAVDKAAKLAQVASKWTILQKEMRNESQWLQIAQQRVPDLQNVSSEDFEQFITLYESLNQDIVYHHAKMMQQNEVAKKMQENVSAPILEKESNEALTVIVQLREEVSHHLNMLVKFKLHWNNYNNSADKLGEWICSGQKTLREIRIPSNLVETPVEDMRNFWEIKAQYEVLNNKVYKNACDSFDRALSTINVSDESLQRQLHGQLLENWLDVSSTISQIQTNISESMKTDSTTIGDKITFIEQELQEIATLFNNTKGVLKSHEDLYAYIEKIQMLRTRIHLIDSELGQIALGADSNTEKISDIFEVSRNVSQQINEEYEAAEIFFKFLEDIENGIKEEENNLSLISKILDSTHVNCKRPDVQKSLDDCIHCQLLLSDSWNKLMRLRQMLHTLPMNLKVSVSPLQTERALSLLQTMHNDLEHRCGDIIIQLKNRLTLWNKFHHQLEMIQEHIQETEFMMELMQLQENADYQRLLTATERLDALLIEIDSRKNTVEDLKSLAQPLIETSDESVSLEIQETVQKITVVWQNTRESLKELCQRYEKAVKLWQHYHDVCKNVKHWVENEASDSDTLEYMNEISQLEIYQNLIVDKKKDLEQLKDLINNINVHVGFNVTGPLMVEIEDFSHKIEEIEENVISHKSNIESNNNQCDANQFVLNQAQQLFDKLQQSSNDPGFNTDMEVKIKHLREYIINLCATESRLEDILNGKQNGNLPDSEIKNLHFISQSLLQDSLEQYQSLTQKIILHGNDDNFINIWDNYMVFVKIFLAQDIPCDDTELRKLRNQYSLIVFLLKDFEALIMKKNCINMTHATKYNCLNQQHSEYIITIENHLVEIENRLRHWDKYNSIKSSLKEYLSYIEHEKYGLQLEYISLKEISKMKNKVDALHVTFPQIGQDLDIMQHEASEILTFTKDEHIMIQIRSDHGKLSQQASKLKESIETWVEFLSRIKNLHEHFHSQCDQIQYNLVELNRCLEEVKKDNLGASQHHLNMLKNEQLRLAGIKDTLTNTNEIRDELKQRISVFDAKLIHQRLWQLWQMFEKLDYSLSVLLKQMQERLQNLKLFSQQYTILTNWMMEFENRINDSNKYQTCEDDATFIKSVEELLLQELLLKENEIEWFNIIGSDLVTNLQKGEEQLEIQSKLELLNSNWSRLKTHCHNRTQKIQEVNSTTISLQRRIEDIKAWMNRIEHDLKSPFMFESLDDATLNKLMDQYDNLQRSIEGNSGNIGEVLNLYEMLFTDVESWNVHIDRKHVLHDINNLELRWKNICLESTKRKQDLFSIWNMLLEIEKIIQSYQEWVEKCNRYLDTVENLCQSSVNMENMSEILEELAIRNSDMITQEPISHILRKLFVSLNKHERVDAANMRNVTTVAKKVLSIWECLLWRSNKLKKELCDLQTMHTTFITEYENIIMALTQIDVQVTNIKHLSGAPDDTPEIKRKRLRDLHNELRFVINLFDKQDQLGSILMGKIAMPNSIHLKIQEYHDFANNIKTSLDTLLSETIQESNKQKSQHSSQIQTEIYEKDSAVQVNTLPTLSHSKSITAKEAYQYQLDSALVEARGHLENLQKAINEINVNNFMTSTQKVSKVSATCESSIELIKHLHLMVLSETQSNDEDTMSKLVNIECDKFTQFQTEWRTKQQKLEELSNDDYLTCPLCTNRNWQQIDNDLWRLEQWLQMAEANQKSQHTSPPTDIDTLEDTIQDHREFLLDLDSHKSIIKSLNIVGEHLATHTLDTEKAVRLRQRLQADNQRWEKVCSQASHWQSQLHHALMDNKEFHRTVTELCTWLEQTENKIKSSEPIDLTSDMKLIERKYKTFRELRSDLVRCEPRVVSLQETTSQLTKYLEANKSQQFDEIFAKLTDLRLRFHSIRRLVEMYTIKIAAALGYDPTFETSSIASVDSRQGIQGVSGSLTRVAGQESNANAQEGEDEQDINTTVLTRSYRFLGRVVRASLPIQAMLLLLLGVVTLMPHGEDYSCTLTNNFARSLEPMLRYPNGPPPI